MAKKIATIESNVNENNTPIVFDPENPDNKNSLSIIAEGNKRFSLVNIPYNEKNKTFGEIEVLASGLDRFEVEGAFKIEAVKRVFGVLIPQE